MSDQREPFVMPNGPPPDAEIDEVGGLPQREPERWTRNPIRPDECPHCQEYDWPEVWQLRAERDRDNWQRRYETLRDAAQSERQSRMTDRETAAEREVERLRERVAEFEQAHENLSEALRAILNELGVPNEGYPAPVANAIEIARAALAETEEEGRRFELHLDAVLGRDLDAEGEDA